MFEPVYMRRARPSIASLAFSLAVCGAGLAFTVYAGLFGALLYVPLAIAAVIGIAICAYRFGGLRASLPKPYGEGRVTRIDATATYRHGVLIMVGGVLALVAMFGSVYLVSPFILFFPLVFGLMIGLPLSQALYYASVMRLEERAKGRIFVMTEEVTENDQAVLLKTAELRPMHQDGAAIPT